MGIMDELKKLTRPYGEDDDEFVDEAVQTSPPPAVAPAAEKPRSNPFSNFSAESASIAQSSVPSTRVSRPREGRVMSIGAAGGPQLQVVLIKPERYETAADIADHLRNKRAVLINLEDTPKEVTRRLVDFLTGVAYAIDGNIRRVATSTYMLTPPGIDLVGDQLNSLGNGSSYL